MRILAWFTGLTSPLPYKSIDRFTNLTKMEFRREKVGSELMTLRLLSPHQSSRPKEQYGSLFKAFGFGQITRQFDPKVDFTIYSSSFGTLTEPSFVSFFNGVHNGSVHVNHFGFEELMYFFSRKN
jgi:hypothetical protein